MNTEEIKLEDRTNADLLELVLQLHTRANWQPNNKVMHDNYVAARNEMDKRLQQYEKGRQESIPYTLEEIENMAHDKAIGIVGNYDYSAFVDGARWLYELRFKQESKWIPLNIDLLEIELISAAYKVTEEYLFTDGTNVGIGKIKIYHAHALRFNPGDWWPMVDGLNRKPTHYMPKPFPPDQGKESKE